MSRFDYLGLLGKELVIAVGCTEPIAVTYAAAVAKRQVPDESVKGIVVLASQGILKNARAISIPKAAGSRVNRSFNGLRSIPISTVSRRSPVEGVMNKIVISGRRRRQAGSRGLVRQVSRMCLRLGAMAS